MLGRREILIGHERTLLEPNFDNVKNVLHRLLGELIHAIFQSFFLSGRTSDFIAMLKNYFLVQENERDYQELKRGIEQLFLRQ